MSEPSPQPALKRTLTFRQLTFYGIGTILGAGIYVLIGEVAGEAGLWAPVSFVIAAGLAALTGLTFCELSSRFPFSAGEAVYVNRAFGSERMAMVVGLMVVLTGIVSSATLVNGFVGYFGAFYDLPDSVLIPNVCLILGTVAVWGIAESVGIAVVITLIEVIGLLIVVAVALPDAVAGAGIDPFYFPPSSPHALLGVSLGVLSGAGIAFYAFIGFEDMVNVAEEVKGVRRVMPRAIIVTLIAATALYLVVAVVVVRAMPLAELTATDAPLAAVFERATGSPATVISLIALFAVINGALIQILMASRVLYGEAAQGWLPKMLGRVNPYTRTPVVATALVTGLVLIFALWLPLGTLARLTSFIILVIFTLVNAALVRIKTRDKDPQTGVDFFRVPLWVPVSGMLASAAFVVVNGFALIG